MESKYNKNNIRVFAHKVNYSNGYRWVVTSFDAYLSD